MRNGECYQRQTLAHLTGVIESGFSPDNVTTFHTPMTTGLDGGSNGRKALKKKQETIPTPTSSVGGANHNSPSTLAGKRWAMNLSGYAQKYPTPTVCGNYNQKGASPTSGDGLATFVKKYPTPTAHNAKETNAPSEALRNEPSLASIAGGKLNPTWVEWLMGWPLGWTDLKQLEMGKYHSWLQQHGKF
jgi:DNA (cytosine-5)-methyltransferase 1